MGYCQRAPQLTNSREVVTRQGTFAISWLLQLAGDVGGVATSQGLAVGSGHEALRDLPWKEAVGQQTPQDGACLYVSLPLRRIRQGSVAHCSPRLAGIASNAAAVWPAASRGVLPAPVLASGSAAASSGIFITAGYARQSPGLWQRCQRA